MRMFQMVWWWSVQPEWTRPNLNPKLVTLVMSVYLENKIVLVGQYTHTHTHTHTPTPTQTDRDRQINKVTRWCLRLLLLLLSICIWIILQFISRIINVCIRIEFDCTKCSIRESPQSMRAYFSIPQSNVFKQFQNFSFSFIIILFFTLFASLNRATQK